MQPSNAHVVRFIELGPAFNTRANESERVQQAAGADQANDHAFGSPCHSVAPRQNPRRNAAIAKQTAATLLQHDDLETD